jgi:hypothetical protein
MRAHVSVPVVLTAFVLAGCAQISDKIASSDAATVYAKCTADVRASAESQLISARLWLGDGTDGVSKLTDAKPFSPIERDALTQVHDRTAQCRQIVAGDKRSAAWQTPPWQESFQRGDAIYSKLSSGEITVGMANRLTIESRGRFQAEALRGHPDAVRPEEVQQQKTAEAMLQATPPIAAAQPRQSRQQRVTTTNCAWFGNALNCTTVR